MLHPTPFSPQGRTWRPVRPSLIDLGRRAISGDRCALEELLRTVQAPVLRYLTRRLADHPDGGDIAGDLRQEVLLRAAAAMDRCHFENERRLLAWILSITRNVLVDYLRSERTRHEVVPRQAFELIADRASLEQWQRSFPEHGRTELLDRVAALAMTGLPRETLELLRLRVQLGRTWGDIATALGTTPSAAKRRYQRAQAALRGRFLTAFDDLPQAQRDVLLRSLRLMP